MNKVIFTSLLLILPFCKAADPSDIAGYIAKVDADVCIDTMRSIVQGMCYYSRIYTARPSQNGYELNLKDYAIESINDLPSHLFSSSLWYIFLDNNLIKTTEGLESVDLPILRVLTLNNNLIKNFPDNSNCRNAIMHLRLDDNQIKEIPKALGYPYLEYLSLKNNQITTIDPQVLNQFTNLITLCLEGNLLEQDNITQLNEYVRTHRPRLEITFGKQKHGFNTKRAKR